MDLDKLAAAGDRVKRAAKLTKLAKKKETDGLNEKEAADIEALKKKKAEDQAAIVAEQVEEDRKLAE